ncbi:hypothetical protein H4R35_002864 [Dimargaris xerosporica]|nr:hypothetical protein H4R35_002864 [Dimargaris xerosporica]
MDSSAAASHPLSPLITALCFTVLLSDWQTLSELEHPVLANLRGPIASASVNTAPQCDSSIRHSSQDDGGRPLQPASAVSQQEDLLTMLQKAWVDAQMFLAAQPSSAITTPGCRVSDHASLAATTEGSERVLALVLDTFLVRLGVPMTVLNRWFQVDDALPAGKEGSKSPELPMVTQEYAQRHLVWQPESTLAEASDLSQHIQSAMTRQIASSRASTSKPLPQLTAKLPAFLRIYMDTTLAQLPDLIPIYPPATDTWVLVNGSKPTQPSKDQLLACTAHWLAAQSNTCSLSPTTRDGVVRLLKQESQRCVPPSEARESCDVCAQYALQSVLIRCSASPMHYLYDRDLVDPTAWKCWRDGRPEKLAQLPVPLLMSGDSIVWAFYRRVDDPDSELAASRTATTETSTPLAHRNESSFGDHDDMVYHGYDDENDGLFITADNTVDFIACKKCMSGDEQPDNQIVLCDKCDEGVHQRCQRPVVTAKHLTYDPWYCADCWAQLQQASSLSLTPNLKRKLDE